MMRSYAAILLAIVGALTACDRSLGARRSRIISEPAARRHGLTRPWFTQVQLDPSRARVRHMVLDAGTLFVETDQSVLHVIDADTGRTRWVQQVGRRDHPSFAPAANKSFVAMINGSYLYVLRRYDGKLLRKTLLENTPGAAPAVSQKRIYVPMLNGMVTSYLLKEMEDPLAELGRMREEEGEQEEEGEGTVEETATAEASVEEAEAAEAERRESIRLSEEDSVPITCQSYGRVVTQPIVTRQNEDEEYVAWPTDRGTLFVCHLLERERHFPIEYRLETEAGIAAQPVYTPPNPNIVSDSGVIYVASREGFVHALVEDGGDSLWRFSAAEPINERPIVIDQSVFVVPEPGGMYCLDAKTGLEKWWTRDVAQFIAASKDRLYVSDKLGRILVLSRASGARIDAIPALGQDVKLLNTQTDRIYLATGTGLVQCLHEIELTEPIFHQQPSEAPVEAQPAEKPEAEKAPAAKPSGEKAAEGAVDNPFE